MDFIDPVKQRKHKIRLFIGYGLISCAITLATIVLLFAAYGYGFNKKGQIIQSGLVFVSSAPAPAQIYLNGQLNSAATNARLQIPAGQYTMQLKRNGYRTWVRSVGVEGGSVEHFDYPILFPTKIVTTDVKQYSAQPGLTMQTPNRQWLITQDSAASDSFSEYSLSNPKQIATTPVTSLVIPSTIFSSTQPTESWQLIEWSSDNTHAILKRIYEGGSEDILFDRQTPADSINLTNTLNLDSTTTISFYNNHYDQYYLYDSDDLSLKSATLTVPQPVDILNGVINFDAYANNEIVYVTASSAPTGDVAVDVLSGSKSYPVQYLPAGTTYLVAMSQFSGNWYVALGAVSEGKVYVYENPVSSSTNIATQPLVPIAILKVNQPSFLNFSINSQFVALQNAGNFSIYDVLNQHEYTYQISADIAATTTAIWMDSFHLSLINNSGKVIVFDYDGTNLQTLQPAIIGSPILFNSTNEWSYVLATDQTSSTLVDLTSTALRIPADQ